MGKHCSVTLVLCWAALCWMAAAAVVTTQTNEAYDWGLPPGFPVPTAPADNPMSAAKVDLGRHLFYDSRLSANGTQSCASCHDQARAFTDGLARSIGSTGQEHPRASMSLVNVAYARALTWGDPRLTRLEDQALVPMYGERPIELGLDRSDRWLDDLRRDPTYQRLFAAAFGDDADSFSRDHLVKALAAFQRSIISARSPYDRYHFAREEGAISEAAVRGEILFHSRPLSCFTCHGGPHFSSAMGATTTASSPADVEEFRAVQFHNTGLYNLAGLLSYPAENTGLFDVTKDPRDVGKFKAPTLRNIAVTAPYMHDGSIATLEEAIDHYAAGGRTLNTGPRQGVGRDNPNKSGTVRGFTLTPAQRGDLVTFLETLTDTALLIDRRFANPWTSTSAAPTDSRRVSRGSIAPAAQRAPTIAAAANLNVVLPEIIAAFARERQSRVEPVFGASGMLARQIQDGAPFELFLAADEEFPQRLTAAGLTRDAGVVYASGRLALFAPKGSPLTVDERLEGLARLQASGGVTRFAIANPDVAPYGKAAEAVLRKRHLWDGIRPKLVLGDSIAQAAQFATTGNAVGGLVAYSLVLSPQLSGRGTHALIAEADHEPLRQRMVVLKRASPAALAFYEYLQSERARALLRKHGYEVPQTSR